MENQSNGVGINGSTKGFSWWIYVEFQDSKVIAKYVMKINESEACAFPTAYQANFDLHKYDIISQCIIAYNGFDVGIDAVEIVR